MPQSFSSPSSRQSTGRPGGGAGYGQIHSAISKAVSKATVEVHRPFGSGAMAKPAMKPMCGPSAFEMLRKLDEQKSKSAGQPEGELVNADGSPQGEEGSVEAGGDDGAFMMPSDSDSEASSSGQEVQLQPAPSKRAGIQMKVLHQVARPTDAPEESGARGSGGGPVDRAGREGCARGSSLPPSSTVQKSASSGVLASSQTEGNAQVIGGGGTGSAVRVRSYDPRPAVAASRALRGDPDDSDSDSSDNGCQGARGGVTQWKANVRSLVQEFAKEERSRKRPAGAGSGGSDVGGAQVSRPPRVPHTTSKPEVSSSQAVDAQSAAPKRAPRREVEYTPATLAEYKEKYGAKGEKMEMGHLGPDLDDEGLLMKRAVQEKMKEFSKELHRINKHRQTSSGPKPQAKPEAPKLNARAKALEFAKNVPRPKLEPKAQVLVDGKPLPPADLRCADVVEKAEGGDCEADLIRREQKHLEDAEKAAQIKEFLKRMPI